MVERNRLQPCSSVSSVRSGDFRSALCFLRNDLAGGIAAPLPQPVALSPDFDDVTYITQTLVDPTPLVPRKFTLSFWFRISDADGDAWDIINVSEKDNSFWNTTFRVTRMDAANNNKIQIAAWNPAGTPVLNVTSSLGYTLSTNPGWHHVVFSVDMAQAFVKFYIDDLPVSFTINNFVFNQQIAFEVSDGPADEMVYEIGGGVLGSVEQFKGCLSQVWFAPGAFYQLDQPVNRALFITPDFKPANLGLDGTVPLNGLAVVAPYVYLRSSFDVFGTNSGTRGDFTLVGTTTACISQPEVGV